MDIDKNAPKVIICAKNTMVLKKLQKVLFAAQVEVITKDSPPLLEELKREPDLLIISEEFLGQFLKIPKNYASMQTIVLYSSDAEKIFSLISKDRRINHVIGIRVNSQPLPWELLATVRRIIYKYNLRGLTPFLGWSARIHEVYIPGTKDLHKIVDWIPSFCEALGAPPKVRESFAELGHELLMNAMYDAPVDSNGKHIYAQDRKQDIVLKEDQYPLFSIGTNGDLLGITVKDPFGGLKRKHVFSGIERALTQKGQMDTEGGGAGLGMLYIYNHGFSSFFTVKPGISTEVTVLYDLTLNRREFATQAKSVHYLYETDE
jgi:hypothetical protein